MGTAQNAGECKHLGTGKKGKKNKEETEKVQNQREVEGGFQEAECVKYHQCDDSADWICQQSSGAVIRIFSRADGGRSQTDG